MNDKDDLNRPILSKNSPMLVDSFYKTRDTDPHIWVGM